MDSIITHLKKAITLEHCAVRFLTAWCFICLMQTIVMNVRNVTINTLDYARMVKLPFMAAALSADMSSEGSAILRHAGIPIEYIFTQSTFSGFICFLVKRTGIGLTIYIIMYTIRLTV